MYRSIKKLDNILKELSKPQDSPSVEVDLSGIEKAISKMKQNGDNQNEIPNAIRALSDVIIDKINSINKEKKQWTFKVKRNADGFIDVVHATSK